ncbi:unnamed protein product [Spodoptera exigua]|nr:unnamed protein product [Spodoptera exigua]
MKHLFYRHGAVKSSAWDEVVKVWREFEPYANEIYVKLKVSQMRSRYARQRQMFEERKANHIPYRPTLWYYHHFDFLPSPRKMPKYNDQLKGMMAIPGAEQNQFEADQALQYKTVQVTTNKPALITTTNQLAQIATSNRLVLGPTSSELAQMENTSGESQVAITCRPALMATINGQSQIDNTNEPVIMASIKESAQAASISGQSQMAITCRPALMAAIKGPAQAATISGQSQMVNINEPVMMANINGSAQAAPIRGKFQMVNFNKPVMMATINGPAQAATISGQSQMVNFNEPVMMATINGPAQTVTISGQSQMVNFNEPVMMATINRPAQAIKCQMDIVNKPIQNATISGQSQMAITNEPLMIADPNIASRQSQMANTNEPVLMDTTHDAVVAMATIIGSSQSATTSGQSQISTTNKLVFMPTTNGSSRTVTTSGQFQMANTNELVMMTTINGSAQAVNISGQSQIATTNKLVLMPTTNGSFQTGSTSGECQLAYFKEPVTIGTTYNPVVMATTSGTLQTATVGPTETAIPKDLASSISPSDNDSRDYLLVIERDQTTLQFVAYELDENVVATLKVACGFCEAVILAKKYAKHVRELSSSPSLSYLSRLHSGRRSRDDLRPPQPAYADTVKTKVTIHEEKRAVEIISRLQKSEIKPKCQKKSNDEDRTLWNSDGGGKGLKDNMSSDEDDLQKEQCPFFKGVNSSVSTPKPYWSAEISQTVAQRRLALSEGSCGAGEGDLDSLYRPQKVHRVEEKG